MLADVGYCEGCGESVTSHPPHFQGMLAMLGISGFQELCLPLHPSSPVCLSVSKCVLFMGTAALLDEGPS